MPEARIGAEGLQASSACVPPSVSSAVRASSLHSENPTICATPLGPRTRQQGLDPQASPGQGASAALGRNAPLKPTPVSQGPRAQRHGLASARRAPRGSDDRAHWLDHGRQRPLRERPPPRRCCAGIGVDPLSGGHEARRTRQLPGHLFFPFPFPFPFPFAARSARCRSSSSTKLLKTGGVHHSRFETSKTSSRSWSLVS